MSLISYATRSPLSFRRTGGSLLKLLLDAAFHTERFVARDLEDDISRVVDIFEDEFVLKLSIALYPDLVLWRLVL